MLYASSTEGIVRLDLDSGAWTRLGPEGTSTESFAVSDGGRVLVAAITPDYGLPMRASLRPADPHAALRSGSGRCSRVPRDLQCLAIAPSRPDVLYAATPQGVYRSDDGGQRWEQRIEGLEPLYCRPIAVHPTQPDVAVTVATHGASGFF